MTERETLLAEIAEKQARLAELDALDPLLIEAREIAARCSLFPARIARDYLGGEMDKGPLVTSVLAALRRGMELAKAPPMGSVMTDAEIEELTKGELPYTAARIKWAVKRTLSRVQPRWPSEAELREMWKSSLTLQDFADRIRAYQTGEQP
jgi:hypothetical protein